MGKWIEGTVIGQKQWTDRLFSLQVDAEVGAFEPGQWTKLALPVGGEFIARPYSFVNAPKDRPHEFYYNTVPEGHLSPRLARLEPWTSCSSPRGRGSSPCRRCPTPRASG
jgi:ferredoxin--NADP+ reductase